MKNIRVVYLDIFQFLEVKFSIHLNRRVFVMISEGTFSDIANRMWRCCSYSLTSIARTPMAGLPWLIRTRF